MSVSPERKNQKNSFPFCDGCGSYREFTTGTDWIFITSCDKCGSKGILISHKGWKKMMSYKSGKCVSPSGEVRNI